MTRKDLRCEVFLHDLKRPDVGTYYKKNQDVVKDGKHLKVLITGDDYHEQRYSLLLSKDLWSRFVEDRSDTIFQNELIKRLILTCNMLFEKSTFTRHPLTKIEPEIVGERDSVQVSAWLRMEDQLDEDRVLDLLRRIRNVFGQKDVNGKSLKDVKKTRYKNLRGSLEKYLAATEALDRECIFDLLYMALEKAVDIDNDRLRDKEFDRAAECITGISHHCIEKYRHFANRSKHPSTYKDGEEFDYGKRRNQISDMIADVRRSAIAAIEYRLTKVI